MGQTVQQIEAHIDDTRDRLGANFQELERRVDAVTDLRGHFEARPFTILGVAFAGGVLLAAMSGRRSTRPARAFAASTGSTPGSYPGRPQRNQALDVWDTVKGAAVGLAATRLRSYIDELVPGFDEQFQRAESRAAALRTSESI
jgi:hypothetical protein